MTVMTPFKDQAKLWQKMQTDATDAPNYIKYQNIG